MKEIGIIGLSADPITNGHIQLAQFVLDNTDMEEIFLTPCYNHMHNKEMVSAEDRLKMCELAVRTDSRIKVFDYEIKNQLAGETFNFFKRLRQEEEFNKKYNFSMIIGLDNANSFDKWVNYEELERMVRFVVVPRKGYVRDEKVNWYLEKPHIFLKGETDIIECSSTFIREKLNDYYHNFTNDKLKSLAPYLNVEVLEYILEKKLYKK